MSDIYHVSSLTAHPAGGYQNFVPFDNSQVSFGSGPAVRINDGFSFSFGSVAPKYPPVIQLPFSPDLLAASATTIRVSGFWPRDNTMQLLLQTIIDDIAPGMKFDRVLTAPAAVGLTSSAFRLAGYLINTFHSGAKDRAKEQLEPWQHNLIIRRLACRVCGTRFPESHFLFNAGERTCESCLQNKGITTVHGHTWTRAFLDLGFDSLHGLALEQFKHDGWSAATPSLPQSILGKWWQLGKSLEPPIPANFDSEAEQFACGVVVRRWIQLLLEGMNFSAREVGSPLLSLDMLESSAFPRRTMVTEFVLQDGVHLMCEKLTNNWRPILDATPTFLKESQFTLHLHYDAGEHVVDFNCAAALEDHATARILDSSSWYHQPHLLKLIAQQFVNGARQPHFSDALLAKMRIRPSRLQWMLPLFLLTHRVKRETPTLYLNVTDAQERDWRFFVEYDGRRGRMSETSDLRSHDSFRQDILHALATVNTLSDGSPQVDATRGANVIMPENTPWTDFQLHLSPRQEQIIHHLKQASELNKTHWTEASRVEGATQRLPVKQKASAPSNMFASNHSTTFFRNEISSCFAGVQHFFGQPHEGQRAFLQLDGRQTMIDWRAHTFEQILLQTLPLMDFSRQGMHRYADMHPLAARRSFQACAIDAAMEANGMNLLPKVLVDIIVDYHCLNALPYITLEEQTALASESR